MLLAIHLGDELHAHELVELLESRASRHFGREPLGIGKDFVHVRITSADDLRGPGREDVEGRAPSPSGENGSRVLLELAASKVDVNDLAAIEIGERQHDSSARSRLTPARSPGHRAPSVAPKVTGGLLDLAFLVFKPTPSALAAPSRPASPARGRSP